MTESIMGKNTYSKLKEGVKLVLKRKRIPSVIEIKRFMGFGRSESMPLPEFAQIEVTTKCNFRCIACSRTSLNDNRLNRNMSIEEFKYIVDQIKSLKTVKLQGLGEPFLNRDITQMAQYAKGKGLKVMTISNGSIIPLADTLKFFDEVIISFDSSDKTNFEFLRKGANFGDIENNLKRLVSLKKELLLNLKIKINVVISHLNYKEIPTIAEIANNIGLEGIIFVEVENWFTENQSEFKESAEFVRNARSKSLEISTLISEVSKRYRNIKVIHLSGVKRKPNCTWSFYSTFITVDGYVTPCCIRMDKDLFYFDNIFKKDFTQIWNSKKIRDFRLSNIQNSVNPICDFCPN